MAGFRHEPRVSCSIKNRSNEKNDGCDVTFAAVVRYIDKQKTKTTLDTTTIYTQLLTEVRSTLYRLAISIVADGAEAEDIVQDVSERAWRARDKVLQSEHPRAYVCRMAYNLAIDRARHRKRERLYVAEQSPNAASGDRAIEVGDMAQLTKQLIASLPDKQRTAIHMRDVEGYEIEEIAELLDIDPTSVRMNLSRARKSIREELLKALNYGVERHTSTNR